MQQLLLLLLILEAAFAYDVVDSSASKSGGGDGGSQRTRRARQKVPQKERRTCRGARKSQTRGSILGEGGQKHRENGGLKAEIQVRNTLLVARASWGRTFAGGAQRHSQRGRCRDEEYLVTNEK